ncbi:N-glycosidase YbiA, partial [Shigella flexneri]
LATAPAKLVEHTENDAYWGDGGNGKGKNRLGYLLMELREQLAIEK